MIKNNLVKPIKLATAVMLSSCLLLCSGKQANAFTFRANNSYEYEYDALQGKFTKLILRGNGDVNAASEQIDLIGILQRWIITPLKKVSPLEILKGLFTSYSDTSGDFDIATLTDTEGAQSLVLTPTFSITSPNDYGDINFVFESTDFLTSEDTFVGFNITFEGTNGSEQQFVPVSVVVPVPESSSTLSILALGIFGSALIFKRQKSI